MHLPFLCEDKKIAYDFMCVKQAIRCTFGVTVSLMANKAVLMVKVSAVARIVALGAQPIWKLSNIRWDSAANS